MDDRGTKSPKRGRKQSQRETTATIKASTEELVNNPDAVTVCAEIRRRRHNACMTLEVLAERANLTPNYIGTVENGNRDPSITTLEAIADGLNIPVSALFGEERELGPEAMEVATLYQELPLESQIGLSMLLRAMIKRKDR